MHKISDAYRKGQWESFDRVLALLQTYDEDKVKRSRLYQDVMNLRPKPYKETD